MSESTPTTPESSRVISTVGVRRTDADVITSAFGESRVRARLITEREVAANAEYLAHLKDMATRAGSYRNLLSGESEVSSPPSGQGEISSKRILNEKGVIAKGVLTFGGALAGPDYALLKSEHPHERFKFYSSFDLTTPEKVDLGNQWFGEVVDSAAAQKLSMTVKSFDHAYDSLNIYTWNPHEMSAILQELYPKYLAQGLYYETPHFLQGELAGVNPNHIGFAQEPPNGWGGRSHSSRMGIIGAAIDANGGDVTPDIFKVAALSAGVNPARPYLIAA